MNTNNTHAEAALLYLAAASSVEQAINHLRAALDTGAVPGTLDAAARLTFAVDELLDLAVS